MGSLRPLKLNVDADCFSFNPPKALFEINKSTDRQYNKVHVHAIVLESDEFYEIVMNLIFCARHYVYHFKNNEI